MSGWAAAGQAASSIGSSLIQNAGNANQQRKANKFNVTMWDLTNKYNHPSQQMSRLREAGLNPNLVYGQGSQGAPGQADKVHPAKAAPFTFENPLKNITSFADLKQKEAQTDNLKQQNTVLEQEAILKGAQTAKLGTDTAKSKFDLGLAEELRNTSLQAAEANLNQMRTNTIGTDLDNRFKDQSLKNRVEDIVMRIQNAKANLDGTLLTNQLKKYEIELNQIGIQKDDNLLIRWLGKGWQESKKNPNPNVPGTIKPKYK